MSLLSRYTVSRTSLLLALLPLYTTTAASASAAAAAWHISTRGLSVETTKVSSVAEMSELAAASDGDAQQDNAALLLWSLGAWHRQQQRYREWIASNRRRQQQLRAISKVRPTDQFSSLVHAASLSAIVTVRLLDRAVSRNS